MNKSIFLLFSSLFFVSHVGAILFDDDIDIGGPAYTEIVFYEIVNENILLVHAADALSDITIPRRCIEHIILSQPVSGAVDISGFPQLKNVFYDSSRVEATVHGSTQVQFLDIKDSVLSVENYPQLLNSNIDEDKTWTEIITDFVTSALSTLIEVP